jgi:hypothetical protein
MQMAINNSPTMAWQPMPFSSFSCKLQTADAAADRNKSRDGADASVTFFSFLLRRLSVKHNDVNVLAVGALIPSPQTSLCKELMRSISVLSPS